MTGYSGETLLKAQRLRRGLTEAERKLWSILRHRQIGRTNFRRQQPIGPFIVDFVSQEHRLIVEADGGQHADSVADASRTAFLESEGYRVMRFWNNDIVTNLDGVAHVIAEALTAPHPPAAAQRVPPSPSRGEGIGAHHA